MSTDRTLAADFWPWNTLRSSFLAFQAQESRLVRSRQRLALEYQAAFRLAEYLQIDAGQGVLRTAKTCLDQPHDPSILEVKNRLSRMFALRGRSLFRRTPSILALELSNYAADIEQVCRRQGDLAGRLRLVRAMMTIFCRRPEFCGPDFLRLSLISPESARLLYKLRQKRFRDRRANQARLAGQCQL